MLDFYEAKMRAKENMRNRSRDARKSSSHRRRFVCHKSVLLPQLDWVLSPDRSRSRSHSPKRRREGLPLLGVDLAPTLPDAGEGHRGKAFMSECILACVNWC